MTEPVSFLTKSLNNVTLPATDVAAYDAFCKKVSSLRKAVSATNGIRSELSSNLSNLKLAVQDMPAQSGDFIKQIYDLEQQMNAINTNLNGDASLSRREFETAPSLSGRASLVQDAMWSHTSAPTETFKENYRIAVKQLKPIINDLKSIEGRISDLEKALDLKGAPYTPGRWPVLKD